MNRTLLPVAAVVSLIALWIWVPAAQLDGSGSSPGAAAPPASGRMDVEAEAGAKLSGARRSAALAPKGEVGGESQALPGTMPPPRLIASAALKSYVEVLFDGSGDVAIRAVEAYVLGHLEALEPEGVVGLLLETDAPAAIDLVVRFVDRGLALDRPMWEQALFLGLEAADKDLDRLATIAEIAEPRIRPGATRRAAAVFLKKRAGTPRVQSVLIRFGD